MITQQSSQLQRNYKNKAIFTLISIAYISMTITYFIYEIKPEYITKVQNFLARGNKKNPLSEGEDLSEIPNKNKQQPENKKEAKKITLIKILCIFTSLISALFSIITMILVLSSVNNQSIIYIGFLTYCFIMTYEAIVIIQMIKHEHFHKAFHFVHMIIFLLITTFIINSLFIKPRLFSFLYLICYIGIYFFKIIQLTNNNFTEGILGSINQYIENFLQLLDRPSIWEKYEKITDVFQVVVLITLTLLSMIFYRSFSFHNREGQNQLINTSISVAINQFFFFRNNFQESFKNLNFENTKYLLSINNLNQVILYTENLKNGIIVGVYENNILKFNDSQYVCVNVKTDLVNNISYVESPIIVFSDGIQSIAGPNLTNAITIKFNRTNDIIFEDNYLLPTGEYILDKTLSTLAFTSCVNKITACHHLLNGCLLYYPETQLIIGNISENLKISLMVDKVLNGRRIFKIENSNLWYLSPVTKEYVIIDTIANLTNNGFVLINSY